MHSFIAFCYLVSSVLFILSLYGLSSPKTSKVGNWLGIIGMVLAILTTLLLPQVKNIVLVFVAILIGGAIGSMIALRVKMTAMPQLIAGFHSLVGLAAVLIAMAALLMPESFGIFEDGHIKYASLIEMGLGAIIGAITFSGSIVAFLKLNDNWKHLKSFKIEFFARFYHKFFGNNRQKFARYLASLLAILLLLFIASGAKSVFIILNIVAFLVGWILIAPVGGADMPVVISMLNSYSGFAASGIGFTLANNLLIITGALVGASGAILSYVMCKAMNRSILHVIFSSFSNNQNQHQGDDKEKSESLPVKQANVEDVAFILQNSSSVIIAPGYGMAVAAAQYGVAELSNLLEKKGIEVKFAIHPVAGRMPGHMNVLLAEANIGYDKVYELDEINNEFKTTDVVLVIGANDVTNPAAKTNKSSPIYGMPILDVGNAKNVFFFKRSMAPGYSGVENELFYKNNVYMVFGDAKKIIEEIIKNL